MKGDDERMYRFSDKISPELHKDLMRRSGNCRILQSPEWGKVKENWAREYVGVFDDSGTLAASALVLIKTLPFSYSMMYIPRGPIMDLSDEKLTSYFFDELRIWAVKKRCVFIKMDPPEKYRLIRDIGEDVPPLDTAVELMKNLRIYGWNHIGFSNDLSDAVQPRLNMVCVKPEDGLPKLSIKGRKNLNIALKSKELTLEIKRNEGIADFYALMRATAERQHLTLRSSEYFGRIIDVFGENAFLTLVYYDISAAVRNYEERLAELRKEIEACPETSPKKQKKLCESEASLSLRLNEAKIARGKYGARTCIAGTLAVMCEDAAELMYAGAVSDFRRLMGPYMAWHETISRCFDAGCKTVNLGGITGEKDDGLAEFKSAFCPEIHEYIGEYDLPVSKIYGVLNRIYRLYKKR